MNLQAISSETIAGKVARLPLSLIPREAVVPILRGRLRGKRWIVGSAIHRCWLGFYEFEKQRLISSMVKTGTVFYDVGANVGFYSLLAAGLVGPQGQVFAFEPLPRNVAYLRRHLALNRASNVEILELALGEQTGIASFTPEPSGCMVAVAYRLLAGYRSQPGRFARAGKTRPPALDQDGHRRRGTACPAGGAQKCIQRHRPLIFLATHGRDIHAAPRRLLECWEYKCTEFGAVTEDGLGELVAQSRKAFTQQTSVSLIS